MYKLDEVLLSKNQGINTTTEKVKYTDHGYKIVQAKDIQKYGFTFDKKNFVDKDTFSRIKDLHKLKKGDLLFSNIGSQLGNACIYDLDEEAIITWNVMKLTPDPEKVDAAYLCSWLNWKSEEIKALNSSSTMPFVSGKVLGKVDIELPNLQEQEKIASIIYDINEKIKNNTHINNNLVA